MHDGIGSESLATALSISACLKARHEDVFGDVKILRFKALNSTLEDGGWKAVLSVLEPVDFCQ
jgi:hypothetical protein